MDSYTQTPQPLQPSPWDAPYVTSDTWIPPGMDPKSVFTRRIFGYIVDYLILLIVTLPPTVWLIVGMLRSALANAGSPEVAVEAFQRQVILLLLLTPLTFLAVFLYYFLQEGFFNGQTVGKRLVGVRAVMQDGRPISRGAAALRALLLFVDQQVFIGLIVAVLSEERKRVGDLVAKTVVVDARLGRR